MLVSSEKLVLTYWRCADCLDAFTLRKGVQADECNCGGKIERMGDVETDHEVEEHLRSVCDLRCTHASGPHCICKCNCANHGTGKLKTVQLVDGKYKVENFCQKNLDTAREFKLAFEGAKKRFLSKFGEDVKNFETNKWIKDRTKWWEIRTAKLQLQKMKALRVHKKRMTQLNTFLDGVIEDEKQTKELAEVLGGI